MIGTANNTAYAIRDAVLLFGAMGIGLLIVVAFPYLVSLRRALIIFREEAYGGGLIILSALGMTVDITTQILVVTSGKTDLTWRAPVALVLFVILDTGALLLLRGVRVHGTQIEREEARVRNVASGAVTPEEAGE